MTVTKAELEQINRRLQERLTQLRQRNDVLHADIGQLQERLTQSNAQWTRLSRRYRRLNSYIRRLREWLRENTSPPAP